MNITDADFENRIAQSKNMHVVITSIPASGHFIPLVRLAEALEKRGHRTSFLTWRNKKDTCETMIERSGVQASIDYFDTEEDGIKTFDDFLAVWGKKPETKQGVLGFDAFRPVIKEKVLALKPDLVLSDFNDPIFVKVIDDMNIPTVVHTPMPLKIILKDDYEGTTCACCGVICKKESAETWAIRSFAPMHPMFKPIAESYLVKNKRRLILTNTFIGFDPPVHIPPNLNLYGPGMPFELSKEGFDPARLEKASKDLFDWMNSAQEAGQKVLIVSIGTEAVWQQWYVDVIMEGIKKLNEKVPVRSVWGFKNKAENVTLPDDYDREMFWIEEWIPQIELLAHPATAAGITHAGLGGSFEFIHTRTLPLCFPHFADQGANAENFVESKAGLCLFDPKIGSRKMLGDFRFFAQPLFTAKDVCNKFERLLTEDDFEMSMIKLKLQAKAAGGCEKAVDVMENYYVESIMLKPGEYFLEHKADVHYLEEKAKAGFCGWCCAQLCTFLLVIFVIVCGFPGLLNLDQWEAHYSFFEADQ